MDNFEIVVESSSDLSFELRKRFNIYNEYLKGVIYLPNNELLADLDWNNISSDQFYKIVKEKPGNVHTAFATAEEFVRVVEPILQNGKDVLIFAMSSGMSGTYNAIKLNSQMILDDYPERKIIVIDTLKYALACGMLAIKASMLREEGKTLQETADIINELKYHLHEAGPMDDLRFLAASGRLSAPKAFFGQLIGVQPIADFTYDGKNVPLGTLKGNDAADEFVLHYMNELGEDLSNQILFMSHSQRLERALKYKKAIIERFHPKDVIIEEVGQSCGANIGPGLCCVYFFGKKITPERELENKIFQEFKNKK